VDTEGNNQQSDEVKAEVEKGFGLLTLELEVGLAPNGCKYLKAHVTGNQPELLFNLPHCPGTAPS
jgi:hypothetical protein